MKVFQKRPLPVMAEQWFPGDVQRNRRLHVVEGDGRFLPADVALLATHGGGIHIRPGDWVVHDTAGNRYPFPPDKFAEAFEEISPRVVHAHAPSMTVYCTNGAHGFEHVVQKPPEEHWALVMIDGDPYVFTWNPED